MVRTYTSISPTVIQLRLRQQRDTYLIHFLQQIKNVINIESIHINSPRLPLTHNVGVEEDELEASKCGEDTREVENIVF